MKISPQEKAKQGMYMSLRELAIVTGFNRATLAALAKADDFPFLAGKVTMPDFRRWARQRQKQQQIARASNCPQFAPRSDSGFPVMRAVPTKVRPFVPKPCKPSKSLCK
jgi:hypothetical protein